MSVTFEAPVPLLVFHTAMNWTSKIKMQNGPKMVTLNAFKFLNKYLWTFFLCLICSSIYFPSFVVWLPDKIRFIILLCQSSIILNYILAYWPISVKFNCMIEVSKALIFNRFCEKRQQGREVWCFCIFREEQLATWAILHCQIWGNLNNSSFIPNVL